MEMEVAQKSEQRALLVAAEMALAAEAVKMEAQERASRELELVTECAHHAEDVVTRMAALEHAA